MRFQPIINANPVQSLQRSREHLGVSLRHVDGTSATLTTRRHNLELGIPLLSQIEKTALLANIYQISGLSLIYDLSMSELLALRGLDQRSLREHLHASE